MKIATITVQLIQGEMFLILFFFLACKTKNKANDCDDPVGLDIFFFFAHVQQGGVSPGETCYPTDTCLPLCVTL